MLSARLEGGNIHCHHWLTPKVAVPPFEFTQATEPSALQLGTNAVRTARHLRPDQTYFNYGSDDIWAEATTTLVTSVTLR
jgi:hypothetical protein